MTETSTPVAAPAIAAALPTETIAILNSSTLIMGLTKSGKSSLLVTAAEYVWEEFHKVTLYYLSDGGGFPTQMQALINAGIVRLWKMRSRSAPGLSHETCQRAAMGWWPRRINARSGETAPNVQLVAPMWEQYEMYCPNDHLVKTVPSANYLTEHACPTCNVMVTTANMRTRKISQTTKGFEQVGARMYDGITSMISWGMDDLAERTGRGDLQGEKGALGGIVVSGDYSIGQSNRAHYGFMQKRAESLILASNAIPGMVIPPIWTALVQEGSDEGGLRVRGPQLIGQAKTADAPQWFGDTMETIVVEENQKKFRRLNLQQYVDRDGIRHLCGVRSFPGLLPEYLQDEETGDGSAAFTNFSLKTFYRLRDEAVRRTIDAYKAKYTDAPGVPEGDVEYGADVPVPAPKVATPGAPRPAGAPAAPRAAAAPAARPVAAQARPVAAVVAPKPAAAVAPAPAAAAAPATPVAPPTPPTPPPPPAPPAAAAPVTTAPRPAAPSAAATGPQAARPAAPKPPARGPVAPPPGRR
jgi:hypothetical protein